MNLLAVRRTAMKRCEPRTGTMERGMSNMKSNLRLWAAVVSNILLLSAASGFGGSLIPPPGIPSPTMKPLDDIEPRVAVQSLPGAADAVHVISASGSYYLTGDVQCAQGQHGVRIDAADVTLDLNGFAIRGVAGSLDGVHCSVISPGTNDGYVYVFGGLISGCGGNGVTAQNRAKAKCLILQVYNCSGSGLSFTEVTEIDVRDSDASSNGGRGLHVIGDRGSRVLAIQTGASSNGGDGIVLTDVENVELRSVVASNNTGRGGAFTWTQTGGPFKFDTKEGSFSNNGGRAMDSDLNRDGAISMTNVYTLENGADGIGAQIAAGVTADVSLARCVTNKNTLDGVRVAAGVGARLRFANEGSSSASNGGSGYHCSLDDGVVADFTWRQVSGPFNMGNGIRITGNATANGGAIFMDACSTSGNGADGTLIDGAPPVLLSQCSSNNNTGAGFEVSDASCRFESCVAAVNTASGFRLQNAINQQSQTNRTFFLVVSAVANGGNGFELVNASAELAHCAAVANTNDGVRATSDVPIRHFITLIALATGGNDGNGTSVIDVDASFDGCSSSGNTGHGYHCAGNDGSNDNWDFQGSRALLNGQDGLNVAGVDPGRIRVDASSSVLNGNNGVTVTGREVNIQDSDASANTGSGIDVTGTLTLAGGSISSNGGGGLTVNGSLDIRGASVTGNTGNGVHVVPQTAGTYVFKLVVTDNTGHGVFIDNGGTGIPAGPVVLAGTVCGNNGQNGLNAVSANTVQIDDCSFTDNTARGALVSLAEGTGIMLLGPGLVSGNGTGGIEVSGTLVVQGATVSGNTGDGITVTGTLTLNDANVTANTGRGTVATGKIETTASSVSNNGGTGIEVSGTLVLQGGVVADNGGGGLVVSGDLDIRGASVTGNTGDGINVVPQTAGVYVFEVTVTDNTGGGISVNDGGGGVVPRPVTIDHCTLSNNGGIAIEIQNSVRGLVSNNSVNDNGGDGIQVGASATGLRLSGNTTSGNANGLVVLGTGNLIIGNAANGNTTDNYSVLTPGNTMGRIVDDTNIATDESPHANYEF